MCATTPGWRMSAANGRPWWAGRDGGGIMTDAATLPLFELFLPKNNFRPLWTAS